MRIALRKVGRAKIKEADFQLMRDSVKAQIDQIVDAAPTARLNWILGQIDESNKSQADTDPLRIYTLVAFALVEDHATITLTESQLRSLTDMATGALMTLGVGPRSGSASKLYGHLYLALSKSQRLRGRHWQSLWDLQLVEELSIGNQTESPSTHSLAFGFRALRLGHTALADQHFREVALRSQGNERILAHLARIKTLRLSGNLSAATQLADELIQAPDLTAPHLLELKWEELCREIKAKGSLQGMCDAVQREGSHFEATYFLEASLWTHSASDKRWSKRLMKVRYLAKDKNFRPQQEGPAYQLARTIEECNDDTIELLKRLDDLGHIVSELDEQLGVDRVLLGYAAAARWLWRAGCNKLAVIMTAEYRTLCLKLSSGSDPDVLGTMSDLLQEPER
jgi:hypothetical protein